MSGRRTKRYWTEKDRDALLAALATCRDACIRAITQAPINGDVYRSTNKLMQAIDHVVGVLTGDRTCLHMKTHGDPIHGLRNEE